VKATVTSTAIVLVPMSACSSDNPFPRPPGGTNALRAAERPSSSVGWSVLLGRPSRDLRGEPPMPPVDAGRPLRGRVPQKRRAKVLQICWPLDLQRVLDLGWLQHG